MNTQISLITKIPSSCHHQADFSQIRKDCKKHTKQKCSLPSSKTEVYSDTSLKQQSCLVCCFASMTYQKNVKRS